MQTKFSLLVAGLLLTTNLMAQAQVTMNAVDRDSELLEELEGRYVASKLLAHLENCTLDSSDTRRNWPRNRYRFLQVSTSDDQVLRVYINENSIVTNDYHVYAMVADRVQTYGSCDKSNILPVLAIMQDLELRHRDSQEDVIRQNIIAVNEYLTTHRANRIMGRVDDGGDDDAYLDFDVSLKHPVLRRALDPVFDGIGFSNRNRYAQLYVAFSGRFSQYIGSRPSSPVVARRFNPELFLRFWGDSQGYWDIGYGHESNGQRITSELAFRQEEQNYVANNESPVLARDGLSRGWDYVNFAWNKDWRAAGGGNVITNLNVRHYASKGLFQKEPEDYNTWEDGGTHERLRRDYDGISLSAEYFLRDACSTICVQKLELTQATGIGRAFKHNTTTLELTTDFYGLPLHFWGRTGYNNDLTNYYDYSNSWGIGLEFISR